MSLDDRDYSRDNARRIMRDHHYSPKAHRRENRSDRPRVTWWHWLAAALALWVLYRLGYSTPLPELVRHIIRA